MQGWEQDVTVSPTEEVVPLKGERVLTSPRFDEKSVQRAQPAVPLTHARARSWPLWVVVLCVTGGVLGGVLGGLALTLYQRGGPRAEAQAPPQSPSATPEVRTSAQQSGPLNAPPPTVEATHAPAAGNREPKAEVVATAPGADVQGELRAALGGWLAATNERDVARQMSFYAPKVEAFYLARNAPRESVRAEKTRLFARASAVNVEAATPEIRLSPDGRTAVMRFRKRYRIDGPDSRTGEVLQELRWRRTGTDWKIVSERDLRVLQ